MLLKKKTITSREDLVYEAVKESVLAGQLKPKEMISQSDIARQLGVSVIPVRNAISRLVAEGLLTQDPYHSPQVQALSREELEEVLVICSDLEILAARKAVPHIGKEEMARIDAKIDEMSSAIDKKELLLYGKLNREFHMEIYQHSRYPRLCQMIADLWDKADVHRYRSMYDLIPDLAQHTQQEHIRLVRLLQSKQVAEVAQLMEQHKAYSRQCFLTAYQYLSER